MTCKNCGQMNPENAAFCTGCGTKLDPAAEPVQPSTVPTQQPVLSAAPSEPSVPSENKPLSPWAYLGYQILFAIPLVGFILLIVFSTGAAHNINLRNFARSYWCAVLVGVILGVVLAIVGLILSMVFGLSLGALFTELSRASYY